MSGIKANCNGIIPGLAASRAAQDIEKKHFEELKKSNAANKDTQNRDKVVEKLHDMVERGLTEDEAIEEIMKDDIIKEFEYLKNNGLDLKVCFKNWTRTKNRQTRNRGK